MSFFDDDDDEPPRGRPASAPRRTPPAGARRPAGRRSPEQQAIQQRRLIALVAVVVVVILFALIIRGCQSSATETALKTYNNGVSMLIDRSDATAAAVFRALPGAASSQTVTTSLDNSLRAARGELADAQALDVPDAATRAQANLLQALQMRVDAIHQIAANISSTGSTGAGAAVAVRQIALAGGYFYASDVLYKGYAVPEIAAALHGDGIPVGGANGVTINGGQSLSNLGWLQPSFVASEIGAKLPAGGGGGGSACSTGKCGHQLNGVTVGSTSLSTTATNTLPSSPAPTFTLSVTNSGTQNESNVGCKVTVAGASDSGTGSIPQTTPGSTTTCNVTLAKPPAPGTYQVTAEVDPVPGEKSTANNFQTFPVTFQ